MVSKINLRTSSGSRSCLQAEAQCNSLSSGPSMAAMSGRRGPGSIKAVATPNARSDALFPEWGRFARSRLHVPPNPMRRSMYDQHFVNNPLPLAGCHVLARTSWAGSAIATVTQFRRPPAKRGLDPAAALAICVAGSRISVQVLQSHQVVCDNRSRSDR